MKTGARLVLGTALAMGLWVHADAAVTDRCRNYPYGAGRGANLQDFYYAYAALGRTVALTRLAVAADDAKRLLGEASDLCHEAAAFDKLSGKLPDRMRNDYRRITADLQGLGETLATATRQNDADTVNATVTRMQDDYAAFSLYVPPRWLSAVSTLHGARQPGAPFILDW